MGFSMEKAFFLFQALKTFAKESHLTSEIIEKVEKSDFELSEKLYMTYTLGLKESVSSKFPMLGFGVPIEMNAEMEDFIKRLTERGATILDEKHGELIKLTQEKLKKSKIIGDDIT